MKDNCVVLILHGLGRTPKFLKPMETYLSQYFSTVINAGYPSTAYPIEQLVDNYFAKILQKPKIVEAKKLCIVTHSLSSLMLRYYLQKHAMTNLGKIVMLGPPNHGSELAQWLKPFWLYKVLYGPAGQQLGVDSESFFHKLGNLHQKFGIIIGDKKGWKFVFNQLFPGKNDGCVSIDSAKLSGADFFKVMPCNHGNIVSDKFVLQEIVGYFLSEVANSDNSVG